MEKMTTLKSFESKGECFCFDNSSLGFLFDWLPVLFLGGLFFYCCFLGLFLGAGGRDLRQGFSVLY